MKIICIAKRILNGYWVELRTDPNIEVKWKVDGKELPKSRSLNLILNPTGTVKKIEAIEREGKSVETVISFNLLKAQQS